MERKCPTPSKSTPSVEPLLPARFIDKLPALRSALSFSKAVLCTHDI
jgi:hypothetical protein